MKRQFNPQLVQRSVPHHAGGPAQTMNPQLGLRMARRHVLGIKRADHIDRAPISETKPDLVTRGKLPVFARSGNDDDQHLQPGSFHRWGLMGDLSESEVAAKAMTNTATAVAVGAMGVLALAWLLRAVR